MGSSPSPPRSGWILSSLSHPNHPYHTLYSFCSPSSSAHRRHGYLKLRWDQGRACRWGWQRRDHRTSPPGGIVQCRLRRSVRANLCRWQSTKFCCSHAAMASPTRRPCRTRYAPSIHIPKQHPSILWLYYYCQVLHTPPLASQEAGTREEPFSTCSSPGDDNNVQDSQRCLIELMDNFSVIDGEVGKRLNNMVPVPVSTTITSHFASSCLSMQPTFTAICILKHHCECFYSLFILLLQHVPKTNGEIPSVDEAISDHQRLLDR